MSIKVAQNMISLEKGMMLTPLQKLPSNVGDLGKIIVATGFEWLPKVQKISQSVHTASKQASMVEDIRLLLLLYFISRTSSWRKFLRDISTATVSGLTKLYQK